MLPLSPFRLHTPASLQDALALLVDLGPDVSIIAGGTDIVPNMKRGLLAPRHLVSLAGVPALRGIREVDGHIRIGAMTTLDEVASHELVRTQATALAEAAAAVGAPQHRKMGTLGGNLCLDTRCRYYNQTYFWRKSLGFCLKKDGTQCHVVAGGQRCVAAASNDTGAALLALGATIELASNSQARTIAARSFYTADGVANTTRDPKEIVVAVRIPVRQGRVSVYEKLRRRAAIDFPLLSIAVSADAQERRIESLDIVVSALAARPRVVKSAQDLGKGTLVGELPCRHVAEAARKECVPLPNVDEDVTWRRHMVTVLVERALVRAGLGSKGA